MSRGPNVRTVVLLGLFLVLVRSLPGQLPEAPQPENRSSRSNYVGDEACRDCHQEQFETFLSSAHHAASRVPSQTSIAGKFRSEEHTSELQSQ